MTEASDQRDDVLDAVVEELRGAAPRWAATPARQRAALVERAMSDTYAVRREWNEASCRAKGLDPRGAAAGEEMLSGVGMLLRLLSTYHESLLDIAGGHVPRAAGPVHHRRGGRLAVGVLPNSLLDRVLFPGNRAEVWMEPGVDEAAVVATQAAAYERPVEHAGVCLVLGAGNVGSLAPRDVVHHLVVEGRVVVLKASPVNEYLVPYWRRALAAFIEPGFVRVVTGSSAVGQYLVHHPGVDAVHVTGSEATYDAIVFGVGEEGARRKSRGEAIFFKPLSAELGNVSPVVVVPGRWTRREVEYQAAHVATMLVNNAGFNCLSARVLVTHRGWDQRGEFLDALERVLGSIAPRVAYYPGAVDRRDAFLGAHPEARQFGDANPGETPWTLIRDVDARRVDDVCFTVEAFCAVMAETALDASSPEEFVADAVEFCNDVVHGSLCATLLIDPRTRRRAAMGLALERAVADLAYGTVGVNVWHALGIVIGVTPWGAYPGHLPSDIGSGTGTVGNAYMFARPQKSVVSGPFVAWPTPPWFATHRRAGQALRRYVDVTATGSWWRVPALAWAVARG